MANSSAFSAIPELSLEVRLFSAFVNGPMEQNEELLDSLEEIDVRMLNHKTLLNNGVSLGKVDWVEGLLARGADPNLEDDSDLTALSSAEEMLRRDPENNDLRQIMRLLRMVHRRDQAMRRRLETSAVRSDVSSTPPVFLSDHLSAIATFSSSVNALKEEMRSLTAELRPMLDELKEKLCGREELLRCLDAVVTSSIEELTSLSECLPGETTLRALRTTLETPPPPSVMDEERRECVDGMMRKTEVVYGGEEGVIRVRKLYERLYDQDVVTKCLLQFLHRESRFVVNVDCDSHNIERMKETVVYYDGTECSGSNWPSFAEFSTNRVYFGAKVYRRRSEEYVAGSLANVLVQMSLHLCFNNGGKPFEDGDNVQETEWKRALEEVEEEKRRRGDVLNGWIRGALKRKTQTAKESSLAASIPSIIARHGSNEGTSLLREQVPLLFHYFKEHVVATLLDKARE